MIGMGFATLENILYADRFGLQTVMIRAFTAVPAHAIFAIIMGYYIGLAKFNKKKSHQIFSSGFSISCLDSWNLRSFYFARIL